MILRILNALFNLLLQSLARLPFKKLNVLFDDRSTLAITKALDIASNAVPQSYSNLELEYSKPNGVINRIRSEEVQITGDDLPFSKNVIEDFVPILDQIGPSQWRNLSTGVILDLNDVIAEFGEQLPSTLRTSVSKPAWLGELRQLLPVRFIGTERLTYSAPYEPRRSHILHPYARLRSERTVRHYSDNLSTMVQRTLTDYATLSQSLDRTFPVRLVEEPTNPTLSTEEVRQKLTEVEEKRSRIVEAGLLGHEHESLSVPVVQSVDESRRSVLAVYAQDALNKLSVFDDLYARVDTFTRIANARFLYKQVSVSTDGLRVSAVDGSDLDLEMLSSGEQHELVLLYDLLFDIPDNTLIMIDEPELSLHVAWQDEILNDLHEMAQLSNFRVLLATHSPQIIGDNWHLAVELKGPNEL